jgi:hypothetical protein
MSSYNMAGPPFLTKLTKDKLKPRSYSSASDWQNNPSTRDPSLAPSSVNSDEGIRVLPAPESVGASINSEASNSHEKFDPTNAIFKLKPHPQPYDLTDEKLDGTVVCWGDNFRSV